MKGFEKTLEQLTRAMAESGTDDWIMPWHGRRSLPVNVETGKPYNGINILMLWARTLGRGQRSRVWGTRNQWRKAGQPVARGEKSTEVVRPIFDFMDCGTPCIRQFDRYRVFNGDQVLNRHEGHPDLFGDRAYPDPDVERFVVASGAFIDMAASVAAYHPALDIVKMPPLETFLPTKTSTAQQNYYSTLLHELIHWSGHSSRAGRLPAFRCPKMAYAFEELVAEIGAAFLCAEFELEDIPRADHAQYLKHWMQMLHQEADVMIRASALAQRAVDYLLELTGSKEAMARRRRVGSSDSSAMEPDGSRTQPNQAGLFQH